MTHTKGPWEVKRYKHIHYIATEDNTKQICEFSEVTDNNEANARLIASAPELLETLKEVIKALIPIKKGIDEKYYNNGEIEGLCLYVKGMNGIISKIEQAISKAEGSK